MPSGPAAFPRAKPPPSRVLLLTVLPEEHPQYQADQAGEENQQEAAQRYHHRALLLRLRPGNAEGSNEALHQKIQQSHVSLSIAPAPRRRLLVPLTPIAGKGQYD
jgi:hypothetical protein